MARALAHPLRLEILEILKQRDASPSEISEEIGAPLGNVSYHVCQLASFGLVELVRETPRRGAVEHHYRAQASLRFRRSPMELDEQGRRELDEAISEVLGRAERIEAESGRRLAESGRGETRPSELVVMLYDSPAERPGA